MKKSLLPLLFLLPAVLAIGEDERPALVDGLGDHHSKITTRSVEAQKYFDQGLAYSFAFNHSEAERSFREAARLDADCAMCYWGIALVLGPNINAAMDPASVPPAFEAIQKALSLSGKATEREQAYIRALAKRYSSNPSEDRSTLDQAYANAMREVAKRFPDDPDASALFAEALMDTHPWKYWTVDGKPQPWTPEILSTLEGILKKYPAHPLALHLHIHSVEASPNPSQGRSSADRLAQLMPAAGHMVHMPGHIYIRTGDYAAAAKANERAIEADNAYVSSGCHVPQGAYTLGYIPHNYHFLWASIIQLGQSKRSLEVARMVRSKVDEKMMREPGFGTLQHYYSIPLYSMVRFGQWKEILDEPAAPADLLYPNGIRHYARGMAYARTGRIKEAAAELEKVKAIAEDPGLASVTLWEINKTSDLIMIAREVLAGELAAASKDYDQAITHLRKAVEAEDNLTYDEPPPWVYPTRHSLGAVLLEAGRVAEAEAVYREELKKFPRNGWSLFGLHKSLTMQKKDREAASVQADLKQAWAAADVTLSASRF